MWEGVDLGIVDGICSKCTRKKMMKNGDWTDEKLDAELLAI